MISNGSNVTDVDSISDDVNVIGGKLNDVTEASVITAENTNALLNVNGTDAGPTAPTQSQIEAYIKYLRDKHNSQCRKKNFKGHYHRASGNKLARKLARQGSLYGRLSLVAEMFKDMREQKFKDARGIAHAAI